MNETDDQKMLDNFAALAMMGILAAWDDDKCAFNPQVVSSRAYAMAQAMMDERARKEEQKP